jgi:hypothetical protein
MEAIMPIVKIEELVKPLSRMTNKEQFKQAAMRLKQAMVSNHIEKYNVKISKIKERRKNAYKKINYHKVNNQKV